MAYEIEKDERIDEGVRRVAREEIRHAISSLLYPEGGDRDIGIHEARKSLKKFRALLRILRPSLGESALTENAAIRDVARTLSGIRDSAVLIETFDALKKEHAAKMRLKGLAQIRAALAKRKRRAEAGSGIGEVLARAAEALTKSEECIAAWPLAAKGFEGIEEGLKKIYSRGRKSLHGAKGDEHEEKWHELRKRVKDLWYSARLLEKTWPENSPAQAKKLRELETLLGDEHNLAVLVAHVARGRSASGRRSPAALRLIELATASGKDLRKQAASLAASVYSETPRAFIARAGRAWPQAANDGSAAPSEPIPAHAAKRSRTRAA